MIKLSGVQLKQLAEFISNLGLVFFATVVTPALTAPQSINIFAVISGVALAAFCVTMSLIILKGVKNG